MSGRTCALSAALAALAAAACASRATETATSRAKATAGTAAPTSLTSATSTRPRPRAALQCDLAPTPDVTPDPVTGTIAAWRAQLGPGTGALDVDVDVDVGLVVARLQGGKSVSLDLETGARCATLVESPSGPGPSPSLIDPYTAHSGVANGALVGPSKLHVGAVDIGTGEARWSRQFVGVSGDYADEYALRDALQVASAGGLDVISFPIRRRDGDRFRVEEIVVGLDPATGAEKWRRAVVQHAWGQAVRMGREVRLATDGQRVIVDAPDRLVAIDGATGAERWSAPWPRSTERRAFVGAGRVLVTEPGSPLSLRDTSDGKTLAELPSPGGAVTAAVVRKRAVVVAVEQAPGSAFLTAIDASGRARWKRDAAYSIVSLRALEGDAESTSYVLEGSGRLFAIDEQTGAEISGVAAGQAYDFAVAKTRAGGARVLLSFELESLAAFDLAPGSRPKTLDPFLRLHFEERTAPSGQVICFPKDVAWVDGEEKSVWRRELPARMRAIPSGACREHEVAHYLRRPRLARGLLYALIGVDEASDAIALADDSGVLASRRSDGAPLLDRAARQGADALFFDDGTFTLTGGEPCSGPARRARAFARCGASLLYFNGTTALLIDARSWRVEAEAALAPGMITTRGPTTRAAIPLGRRTLTLDGRTYMR